MNAKVHTMTLPKHFLFFIFVVWMDCSSAFTPTLTANPGNHDSKRPASNAINMADITKAGLPMKSPLTFNVFIGSWTAQQIDTVNYFSSQIGKSSQWQTLRTYGPVNPLQLAGYYHDNAVQAQTLPFVYTSDQSGHTAWILRLLDGYRSNGLIDFGSLTSETIISIFMGPGFVYPPDPPNKGYCGYHGQGVLPTSGKSVVFATMKYGDVDGCNLFGVTTFDGTMTGTASPNGDTKFDSIFSCTYHEWVEAVSDTYGQAWDHVTSNENGDNCGYRYATSMTYAIAPSTSMSANTYLPKPSALTYTGSEYFLLQENWLYLPTSAGKSNSGCAAGLSNTCPSQSTSCLRTQIVSYTQYFLYFIPVATYTTYFAGSLLNSDSLNGVSCRLDLQQDGNLVLYKRSSSALNSDWTAAWATNTNGKASGPYSLDVQTDGNVVLYAKNRVVLWTSSTAGKGVAPYMLKLQDDCNLVHYDSGNTVLFSSKTAVSSVDSACPSQVDNMDGWCDDANNNINCGFDGKWGIRLTTVSSSASYSLRHILLSFAPLQAGTVASNRVTRPRTTAREPMLTPGALILN